MPDKKCTQVVRDRKTCCKNKAWLKKKQLEERVNILFPGAPPRMPRGASATGYPGWKCF